MNEEHRMLAALDGLAAGFNAHDIDAIMGFFAEQCSLDLPRGPEPHGSRYVGREEVRRGLMTRFESTPDVHYSEVENFACGNTGISKWLLTGTTPAGENVRVRGCDFYTFEEALPIPSQVSTARRASPARPAARKSRRAGGGR